MFKKHIKRMILANIICLTTVSLLSPVSLVFAEEQTGEVVSNSKETEKELETSEITKPIENYTQQFANIHEEWTMEQRSIGFVGATKEQITTANQLANERFSFDPLLNIKTVGNWDDFVAAYNDASVTKIMLTSNIKNDFNREVTPRLKSIEIDGSGFSLNTNTRGLRIGKLPAGTTAFFHLHDLTAMQAMSDAGGGAVEWYVYSDDAEASSKWYFRVGNIDTSTVTKERISRLLRGIGSEVSLYGNVNLKTTGENFYIGSVVVEEGADWYGEITYFDYSVVWFLRAGLATDTGVAQSFIIGKNSRVNLKNTKALNGYPAVYSWYKLLEVGENSFLNVSMSGNAVRMDIANSSVKVKKGATVSLLSRFGYPTVQYTGGHANQHVTSEPGANIYIASSSGYSGAAVSMGTGVDRTFILDSPASYDIRNETSTANSPAIVMGHSSQKIIINNSDIDLWGTTKNLQGAPQESYPQVTKFEYLGSGIVNQTTETALGDFNHKNYRRISGLNSQPEVLWEPVTDADKSYSTKVLIGYRGNGEFDSNGNPVKIETIATENQATVTYIDTSGATKIAQTNGLGYAVITDTNFQKANKEMTASAARGAWISAETKGITVIDVTPPEPATVDNEEVVSPSSTSLSGAGEAGSLVTMTVDGVEKSELTTTVTQEGTWQVSIPKSVSLVQDSVIQIFLQDTAGRATGIVNSPDTNNDIGNINPSSQMTYRDTVFKEAKKVFVKGSLSMTSAPEGIMFGSISVVDYSNPVGVDETDLVNGLIIEDSRGLRDKKWGITAKVSMEMTNSGDELRGSIKYLYKDSLLTLSSTPQIIYVNQEEDPNTLYNITSRWGKNESEEGLKFQYDGNSVPKTTGNYVGEIEWTLQTTIE